MSDERRCAGHISSVIHGLMPTGHAICHFCGQLLKLYRGPGGPRWVIDHFTIEEEPW